MNNLEILQYLVYFVFFFAIIAYATLDGFDLGVGCLHLFAKGDMERRLMINAIGPVWDGNATWIVIGGGVLFAGFPKVFAISMAGFYTPVMILLFCFMLRGAAVEFRHQKSEAKWRNLWDYAFFFASALLAFNIGMMLGNMVDGFPLNERSEFQGTLFNLFKPYPVLVALLGMSIFMMHGSIYLLMKTEGKFHDRIRIWVKRLIVIFLIMWATTTLCTFLYQKHMVNPYYKHPILGIFALFSLAAIWSIPRSIAKKNDGWAFIGSCLSIVFLLILFGIGTFPNLIYNVSDPARSLTFQNSSASQTTLFVLVIIALIGMPLSFFYFSYLYRVFRGKIKLDSASY